MSATRTRSRIAAFAVATAAALALAGAGPAAAETLEDDPLLPPAGTCAYESDITAPRADQRAALRCLTNHVRANAGLGELGEDNLLWNSAIDKSWDIIECQNFDHNACGLPTFYYVDSEGYEDGCRRSGVAENIAWGSGELGSARNALNSWLHSTDGHRETLLDPAYRDQGVGMVRGTLDGEDDVQIWVHHFGYCD